MQFLTTHRIFAAAVNRILKFQPAANFDAANLRRLPSVIVAVILGFSRASWGRPLGERGIPISFSQAFS
jgi:hypothetical protein